MNKKATKTMTTSKQNSIEVLNEFGSCLDRRIPDKETLKSEVAAWENRRNALACKCNWQFRQHVKIT